MLVLRPEHQASELAALLEVEGATTVLVPAIRILPPKDWTEIDDRARRLSSFDWIVFTSANGVDLFLARVADDASLPRNVGAIGPGTSRRLEAWGITPGWMPGSFTSAAIAEELPDPPGKVLLVRADIATTELDRRLSRRGFTVERVDAYRTEPVNAAEIRAVLDGIDAVALTSASIARSFASAAAGYSQKLPAVCSIGPATSAACREAGIDVDVEAGEHTLPGLVTAMAEPLIRARSPHEESSASPMWPPDPSRTA